MPVTLLYGRERAQVARLVLSLLRTVRNAYTPKLGRVLINRPAVSTFAQTGH